jgi:hypothetical protein
VRHCGAGRRIGPAALAALALFVPILLFGMTAGIRDLVAAAAVEGPRSAAVRMPD